MGIFDKMLGGLAKTRTALSGIVNFSKIDEDLYDELEEALIVADMGVSTAANIIQGLRERVRRDRISTEEALRQALADEVAQLLDYDTPFPGQYPLVILVVGVNGAGKTTSIGKLANMYARQGHSVVLAAGDTFRAAATEQLEVWAQRAGAPLIKHGEGADPGAVLFDAVSAAKARSADILICDTAGRLHNKKNLMNELTKLGKILERNYPEAQRETLLVLDATTGQNALSQAEVFTEAVAVTGIVLTKLDGTAKGGVVAAIRETMGLPVRFVGLGESIEDMHPFSPQAFADALFHSSK